MARTTEFFLTLPSNTKVEGNTTSDFRVPLAYPIELQGQWSVGLAEIHYPATYNTVQNCTIEITTVDTDGPESVSIPDGHYATPGELVEVLNYAMFQYGTRRTNLMDERLQKMLEWKHISSAEYSMAKMSIETWKTAIHFQYMDVVKKMNISFNPDRIKGIKVDRRLQHILGLKDAQLSNQETLAKYPPDLRAGMTSLYIYCDIIAPQLVGDTRTNLLRVVPLRGLPGEVIDIDYPNIHYGDLLVTKFSSVHITIKGVDGETMAFSYGKCLIKLHFRKKRLL